MFACCAAPPRRTHDRPSRLTLSRAFLLAALCLPTLWGCSAEGRRVAFTYEVVITSPPGASAAIEVWLPLPSNTPAQRVVACRVDAPVPGDFTTEDTHGNRLWHARLEPTPDEPLRIVLGADVIRLERRVIQSDEQTESAGVATSLDDRSSGTGSASQELPAEVARFLAPNRLVPMGGRFAQIAQRQTRGHRSVIDRARALYDHVLDRMSYDKSGKGWGRGDADYACDVGAGNCSDFHSLFIALARSVGIPARMRMGFPLGTGPEGDIGGYHCWAEFWSGESGWIPVDISEADKHPSRAKFYFGGLDADRIDFSVGRDIVLAPKQQGPPINFLIYPVVEVDGASWPHVEWRLHYRDQY